MLRCEAPDFIYYHTSLKHEMTKIIVEVIIVEETIRIKGGASEFLYSSTGFAVLKANNLA